MGAYTASAKQITKVNKILQPLGFEFDDLPTLKRWECIVLPPQAPKQTAGGIILPEVSRDVQNYNTCYGTLIKCGDFYGHDPRTGSPRPWGFPEVGDEVIHGKHDGQFFALVKDDAKGLGEIKLYYKLMADDALNGVKKPHIKIETWTPEMLANAMVNLT